MSYRRRSDNLIRLVGPTNASTGVSLDSASGAACIANIYDERKECQLETLKTRIRSDAAVSAVALEIPVFSPVVLEAGDTIGITHDNGTVSTYSISSMTPGSDYDTITIGSGLTEEISAGHEIRLTKKGSAAVFYPIVANDIVPMADDTLEYESDALVLAIKTLLTVYRTTATEDGEPAANQESYLVFRNVTAGFVISTGKRIRTRLGGDITMSQYPAAGPTVAGTDTWGWEGTIPDTTVLGLGQKIRTDILFNGGAGLQLVESFVESVVE